MGVELLICLVLCKWYKVGIKCPVDWLVCWRGGGEGFPNPLDLFLNFHKPIDTRTDYAFIIDATKFKYSQKSNAEKKTFSLLMTSGTQLLT